MERLQAKKPIYEIDKLLGEGLTSQVYKAFREDDKGWSRQKVALKIIHSQNQVQVLKKEFENLIKVNSKHCVKMLAWENLETGPALVLEYIEGVTLHQLVHSMALEKELVAEIMNQCHLGLKALHDEEVFHGDLNLKNIMINTDGVVKLIDFGFQGDELSEQYLTPEFSSPERQKGQVPNSKSDLYSWRHIYRHLLMSLLPQNQVPSNLEPGISRANHRRALGHLVKTILSKQKTETICLNPKKNQRGKRKIFSLKIKNLVASLVFMGIFMEPLFSQRIPQFHKLNLRSRSWFKLEINQLPGRFGPIEKQKMRHGKYQFVLKNSTGTIRKHMNFPEEWNQWKKENKNVF